MSRRASIEPESIPPWVSHTGLIICMSAAAEFEVHTFAKSPSESPFGCYGLRWYGVYIRRAQILHAPSARRIIVIAQTSRSEVCSMYVT